MSPYFSIDSLDFGGAPMGAAPRLGAPVPIYSSEAALEVFDVTPPAAGVIVTERNAMQISGVWCAVNLIANTIATLPLHFYRKTGNDSREAVDDHKIADLLDDRPNPRMSWFTFAQTLQSHVLTWGRAAAEIERSNGGDVIGLWPIAPHRIQPQIDRSGDVYYMVDGKVPLEPEDVIWLPGLGYDGICGYSVVRMARESLAAHSAAEKYGANFFGGDGRPSGFLSHKGKLKKEVRDNMREEWRKIYGGGYNSGRIAILQEEMGFTPLTTPPDDAQFLQTRKFGILEIARWFNVPPHMLKDLDRATFSNIEEQGQDFLTYSILPWLCLWTQELGYKLLNKKERKTLYFEHTLENLLKAKVRDRYAAYAVARQWGFLSINDIRRRENQPLIGPEGDVYMVPANMKPADSFLHPQPAQPASRGKQLLGPDGRSIQEYLRVAA